MLVAPSITVFCVNRNSETLRSHDFSARTCGQNETKKCPPAKLLSVYRFTLNTTIIMPGTSDVTAYVCCFSISSNSFLQESINLLKYFRNLSCHLRMLKPSTCWRRQAVEKVGLITVEQSDAAESPCISLPEA